MKIYLLVDHPRHYQFAYFGHLGTWVDDDEDCEQCELSTSLLTEPILVEWEPGNDVIGDIAWCSYTFIVVSRVRDFLVARNFECGFGRTEVVPPEKPRKRGIVPWPYTGPEFHWVRDQVYVPLNQDASGVTLEEKCDVCGRKDYTFRMDGIVIDRSAWDGQKMFEIEQFKPSGATFITEAALEEILGQEFTNFHYLEAGVIR